MGILAKKSGIYKWIFRPKDITDLRSLDTVRIKPGSFFEQYKSSIGIVIGDLDITERMQEYFGRDLDVIEIDESDDTFSAFDGNDWFWWPLCAVDYVDRS